MKLGWFENILIEYLLSWTVALPIPVAASAHDTVERSTTTAHTVFPMVELRMYDNYSKVRIDFEVIKLPKQ